MNRLLLLLGLVGSALSGARAQTPNFSAVDALLTTNLARYNGSVVCLVKQGNRLVYYRALGTLDSLSVVPIASATKNITAAVVLRLAQEGVLGLDDSIGTYLPRATFFRKGSSTIRQNFAHTGGWAGTSGEDFLARTNITLAQSVDSILREDPQLYRPGTAFKYSGVSMQVGGQCAAVAAGTDWNTLFTTRIKQPLGLSSTTYQLSSPTNPRLAGGINSNARDLMRFTQFILRNGKVGTTQVIDSVWMQEMWRDQTNRVPQLASPYPANPTYNNPYNQPVIYYGFGAWQDVYNPTTRYTEQLSGAGAFGTIYWVDRCRGITGVILTQSNYARVSGVSMQAIDLIRAQIGGGCSTVTAVRESAATASLTLYPNPAHDRIYLEGPAGPGAEVSVWSVTGQQVAPPVQLRAGESLPTTGWPAGLYYVRLRVNGGPAGYRKILVQP
ncbi:serine hydrolase [Hymenobacter sp.]|uniref:serine hydrolase n=1 Tax=Hymenobacter sp. TaxID=1898978 RepID=UPI00286A7B6A|nr:serine hydrolase [Hymenobacter sp.]